MLSEVLVLKKKVIVFIYIFALLVTLFNAVFSVFDSLHFSLDIIPEGTELYCIPSPDGTQQLKIYKINNSLGTAVRGEINNKDGKRNIYWQTGIDDAECRWSNEHTVIINDIAINSVLGSYDCRRGYSIFIEGSLEKIDLESERK